MPTSDEFGRFSIDLARQAGEVLLGYRGKLRSVRHKSSCIDLVTEADIECQRFIVSKIHKAFPEHSILAEENLTDEGSSKYRWVIDPLDGTTNFVHGLPIFAISIGLQIDGITCCGVVYNPAGGTLYHAVAGQGAYCNGEPISVSGQKNLIESILVTGFPYEHDEKFHLSFELFHEFHNRVQGMRRFGAAALDFCFVASGQLDGFYEFNLKPWDICAGDLICREAGGKVTGWSGGNLPFQGTTAAASNGLIHQEMLDILRQDNYRLFLL
ncbi:MAG: inositol monophosphatase [FCB group bacterium]|nr:inositol monophosphatase [FCB group bacterium]